MSFFAARTRKLSPGAPLFALALLALLALAGCGGDDDDGDGATTTAPSGAPTAGSAAEMVPDLAALGFRPAAGEAPALETPNTKIAVFEHPSGPVRSLRLDIALNATLDSAQKQFSTFGDALRNPPPGLLPAGVKQTDGAPAFQADQSRSYVTDKPDNQGGFVYTDLHRFGRVVVIMYTIGPKDAATDAVRKQVAELMAGRAPR